MMAYGWRASIPVFPFPDPEGAGPEGLLAVGGDLSPLRLLSAYSRGIFPWYSEGEPLLWWSPDPRMIMIPPGMKVSRSLRSRIAKGGYDFSFDTRFVDVIRLCAEVPREAGNGTWITGQMLSAYNKLHELGFAHSAEIHIDGKLEGGLYGISIGKAFFGESMFHLSTDASKLAFYHLNDILSNRGFHFIDCQLPTPHLASLGAKEVTRSDFLALLAKSMEEDDMTGSWSSWAV